MGKNTKIEWAHHTFNPWLGCTKVSRACDHCYAESWAKRAGRLLDGIEHNGFPAAAVIAAHLEIQNSG